MNHEHFLGYTKDAKGNLIVDKKEAKVVKRIFREYLEGASFRDIAMGLERDHIKTGGKRYKWHQSTVRGILSKIYFHNLKFDGSFILNYLLSNGYTWVKEKQELKMMERFLSIM